MKTTYQDELVTIHQADCRYPIFLEPGSVDLIVTSPPYNLDVPYGAHDDGAPYATYLEWVREVAYALWELAREGARACINIPLDTNKGGKQAVYGDYLNIFREYGWTYQTSIVWNEQNISRRTAWGSWMSPTAPYVTCPVEMILVFYKDHWRREQGDRTSDITRDEFIEWTLGHWTFPGENPKRVGHPAPFPEELPKRLIKLYSFKEDLILDPFLGSGTTCAVAKKLGRRSVGIEIDPDYCHLAAERCQKIEGENATISGEAGSNRGRTMVAREKD